MGKEIYVCSGPCEREITTHDIGQYISEEEVYCDECYSEYCERKEQEADLMYSGLL